MILILALVGFLVYGWLMNLLVCAVFEDNGAGPCKVKSLRDLILGTEKEWDDE